ncbi:MAG: HEPN domain-containing protein [Cyclobacteriaceae bacterium]|nr:HEPN domain-containing protein [Cyclobacteriaceae bacterium]MCK5280170.1 HEPN domain-containing protein [Cyclobacteriaceae bacterium]MCK5468108.1 HEPN domain-containing protein [Cyclobacteriaceae bacterium]
MKYSLEDLILYRIKRADESIKEAELLASKGYWNTVSNRLYYAVFYLVNALLVKHKFHTRSHSGIKSEFHKHFIKTGILDKKHGKLYSELFDKRQEGDYQAFVNFDESEILPLIEEVKTFYSELNRIILK